MVRFIRDLTWKGGGRGRGRGGGFPAFQSEGAAMEKNLLPQVHCLVCNGRNKKKLGSEA